MMTDALAVTQAAEDTEATAPTAPDDGEDLGEDEGDDSEADAAAEAAEAAQCRQAARLARELAARVLAEARAEAEAQFARIVAEAEEEAGRLAGQAAESDADAAWHELQARVLPQAAAARREITGIRERLAGLAARVPVLQAEQSDAEERLAALADRRAEQEQWREVARHAADVDAIKAAAAEESAITEAEAAQRARAAAAASALTAVAAAAEDARQREDEASARLADLERQLQGYLPAAERDSLADKIASAAVTHLRNGNRDAAEAVLSWCPPHARHAVLGQASYVNSRACCARLLDELCQSDPDAFSGLLDRARDGSLFAVAARGR